MWGIETPDPGEPTRLLAEGDTIEVGDVCLQVIETPGHTPGGIVLFAATEQGNIAFVGDTLSRAVTVVPIFPAVTRRRLCARSPNLPRRFRPIPFA